VRVRPVTLACSACGDLLFRAEHWWADGFGLPLLALLLDAGLLLVVARVQRRPTKRSRAIVVLPCLAIPLLSTLSGIGTIVGIWGLLAVALAATAWSLFANRADGPVVLGLRLALVVGASVATFVMQAPARQETERLARLAAAILRFEKKDGWVFDELGRRVDTAGVVEQMFLSPDGYDRARALRLHAILGLPAAARVGGCRQLEKQREGRDEIGGACDGVDSALPDPPQGPDGGT
jgi:hypothetical protein